MSDNNNKKKFPIQHFKLQEKRATNNKEEISVEKIDNKLRNKTTKIPEIAKNNLQKQIKNIYKLKYKN